MTEATDDHTVVLDAQLDQTASATLMAELARYRGAPVRLVAENVDHVGALFAQMLCSARKTWADEDAAIHIDAPSDAFRASIALLGLEDELLGDRA